MQSSDSDLIASREASRLLTLELLRLHASRRRWRAAYLLLLAIVLALGLTSAAVLRTGRPLPLPGCLLSAFIGLFFSTLIARASRWVPGALGMPGE